MTNNSLALHSVFDIVLIYFFEELQHFLIKFDPNVYPDINHIGALNGSLQTVLTAQPFH